MKPVLVASAFCLISAIPHAQERSAGGAIEIQMTWSSLKNHIDNVQTYAEGVNSRVDMILACSKLGMLYAPDVSGANAQGCKTVGDPTPTDTVAMFALAACPTGWVEYIPARGRFVRGIDSAGTVDPDGKRQPGNVQAASLATHSHKLFSDNVNAETGDLTTTGTVAKTGTKSGSTYQSYVLRPGNGQATMGQSSSVGGNETRPANVALLYCRKI